MLNDSVIMFVVLDVLVVIIAVMVTAIVILHKKFRLYRDLYKKNLAKTGDSNAASPGKNGSDKTANELEALAEQIRLKDSRISNLERFKRLYFDIDRMVRSETKSLFDALVEIVSLAKDDDKKGIMLESENCFHVLKKINPFLDEIKIENFSIKEIKEFDRNEKSDSGVGLLQKQKEIIENLRKELSASRENENRLKQLENYNQTASQTIRDLQFKLEKEYATKRLSMSSGKTISDIEKKLQILERKNNILAEEKLSLTREIEHYKKQEGAGILTPKDMKVSDYVQSLTKEIAKKQTELTKAREDYSLIEKEYYRLFENNKQASKSVDQSPVVIDKEAATKALRSVESDMTQKGRTVKNIEQELVAITETCDEVIDLQSKYDRLKNEYQMLADSVERNMNDQDGSAFKAKINALTIENEHYKEIEKKYDSTCSELNRLRTEYSMLEKEFIALLEAK